MGKELRILVRVLQLDLDAGYREDCEGCPLALAIHRAIGYPVYVLVGGVVTEVDGLPAEASARTIATLPASARQFQVDYDGRRRVRPFGFYLRLAPGDVRGNR